MHFCQYCNICYYVTIVMEMMTKKELIKFAKMQDPESELYKMCYWDVRKIQEKIKKLVYSENDDKLFSILMKLQSHIMIAEDWIREQDIKKTQKHETVDECVCYINKTKMLGSGRIYV